MIKKIDHIAFASLVGDEMVKLFTDLLQIPLENKELVESQQVNTFFMPIGETHLEVLESTKEGSNVDKFLQNRGEGIHHIAFETDNILQEMERISALGFTFTLAEPGIGAGNKLVNFIHPKHTHGILVELCEYINK
ncbi:MAG: hypothetical protein RLZZ175_878 [Bacteroidota bacterium]|jgi:methylmalonyl-CoA/ethylmalonyl-CoA epimerase